MPIMDFFDERILARLRDGKRRGFTVLLGEVGWQFCFFNVCAVAIINHDSVATRALQ
jgi:hypothetical protein